MRHRVHQLVGGDTEGGLLKIHASEVAMYDFLENTEWS